MKKIFKDSPAWKEVFELPVSFINEGQAETLEMQRRALAAIRETLTIVREVERHAESIDRKTGGSAPTGGGLPGTLGG